MYLAKALLGGSFQLLLVAAAYTAACWLLLRFGRWLIPKE